ncbi:MAG: hypothetical protein HC862_14920 [Scytonema sp. RU_4_4]|nr:hypothetical protein [Scytonema sp. RU_4_4]
MTQFPRSLHNPLYSKADYSQLITPSLPHQHLYTVRCNTVVKPFTNTTSLKSATSGNRSESISV